MTGALGGLRHDAGKLFVDIKNLPSGSDMALTDLMVFQDGHTSGSTRVLPIQKLSNLLTGGAGDVSLSGNNTFTGTNIFNGNLTASLGGLVKDNSRLFFGDSEESWIKYDEAGDDYLVISGSNAGGVGISGSVINLAGVVKYTAAASGSHAGPGSFLSVTTAGNVVLSTPPASSGAGTGANNTFTGTNIFNGNLTGSLGLLIKDDKRLFFGDSEDIRWMFVGMPIACR